MEGKQVFRVREGTSGIPLPTVIVTAYGREDAKRKSRHVIGGNPDQYEVTPVTNPDEHCYLVWE